jgi:hypothetical protein
MAGDHNCGHDENGNDDREAEQAEAVNQQSRRAGEPESGGDEP